MGVEESGIEKITLRPTKTLLVIFSTFALLVNVPIWVAYVNGADIAAVFLLSLMFFAVVFYLILGNKIEVVGGRCKVYRPFRRVVDIAICRVSALEMLPVLQSYRDRFRPPFRLAIVYRGENDCKHEVVINAKIYETDQLDQLAVLVGCS